MDFWKVSPDWSGETAILLGGGPSVAGQDLSLLRNRKVIVVNSSYLTYPDADILFFADDRWWREHFCREALANFRGRKVTCAHLTAAPAGVTFIKRGPIGVFAGPDTVGVRRTSMTGAMELAALLGSRKLILLGVDGRAIDGKTHHHAPHPWDLRVDSWEAQLEDFRLLAPALAARNVAVWNASPGSAVNVWPICTLEEAFAAAVN